jgi:hypothetical protein
MRRARAAGSSKAGNSPKADNCERIPAWALTKVWSGASPASAVSTDWLADMKITLLLLH